MARNMITGKETQKMQEYTQEQIVNCPLCQGHFELV